jgi:hypothetical protein
MQIREHQEVLKKAEKSLETRALTRGYSWSLPAAQSSPFV